MGFDLEKRVANELNRLEDEVARSSDIKPTKRLEHFRRIAAELKQQLLGTEVAEESPGKRTQIDDLFSTSISRMQATAARAQAQLSALPWQPSSGFDDFRARGLREVVQALGGERARLQRATVGAAEPAVAARVQAGKQPKGNEAGQAMWRVAERRAATLYRHAMDAGEVASEDPIVDEALARCGSGQALPTPVRKKMEAELGISLARVRVHTDPVAAAAAKAVRAAAFTVGEDIFFGEHQFAPDSRDGQKLLAHELTHVVQAYQGRTANGNHGISVSQPGEALEREADAVADRVADRPARAVEPARMRFSSNASRYAPANSPISVGGPPAAQAVAAAPVVAAPAPQQAAQLLRKPATNQSAEDTKAKLPRDQQNPDHKGTQPRFQHVRDAAKEEGIRTTKKGTKVDPAHLATEGKRVLKGAVTDLKHDVKKATNKPVGKKASDHGKSDHAKHAQLKKHAKDAKKKVNGAKHKGAKHHGGGAHHKAADGHASGAVEFKKISDWQKYMPEDLPDTDAREKKKILELVKKKVNGDRTKSAHMLDKLAGAQKAEAASIRAMGPALVGQIKGAMSKAIGAVSAAEGQQVAAVQGAVAASQARVRATASAMVGQITGAHAAALQSIKSADTNAKQKLTDAKTTATNAITTSRAAQHVAVTIEYLIATGRMVAIGAAKAAEALALPASVSLPYSGDKLEAAEKAAKEVAGKYSEAMPGEAAKAAADLRSTKADVDSQVDQMADHQVEAINQAFDQAKQTIEDATRQATEAANTLKQQAVTQVNSTSSTTCSQLAAQGAQQVSSIRSAAQGARSGITSAGNSAAAGMQSSVAKAAEGIASGAQGLIKGAKQVELADPHETHKQVTQASQQLKQGSQQIASGFKQTVSQTSSSLSGQASSAAQGMAQTAAAAKSAAQNMASQAGTTIMSIGSGAKDGLTQLSEGHRENVTKTSDTAKDQMKDMADKLKDAYDSMRSTLNGKLNEGCENARTQFGQAVPTDERAAILENAKKAADAVKPWWQKALAFVVQIVVAVAITIAVGALIGATGGLALVAVGLLAGALSTVGGQMAHNLVMGDSLFNGITVRSVLAGAIGGAVTAGFGAGLQSGLSSFGGAAGGRIATTLATKGAGGLGGALMRTGAGVAGDMVGDAATQFVATGHYDFNMQTLVQSVVMNGITQGKTYGDFEAGLQKGIRTRVPSLDISTGHSNSPMGARPAGESGNFFNAQGNHAGSQGKLAAHTPPAGGAHNEPPAPHAGANEGPRAAGGHDTPAGGGTGAHAPEPAGTSNARPADSTAANRPGGGDPAANHAPTQEGSTNRTRTGAGDGEGANTRSHTTEPANARGTGEHEGTNNRGTGDHEGTNNRGTGDHEGTTKRGTGEPEGATGKPAAGDHEGANNRGTGDHEGANHDGKTGKPGEHDARRTAGHDDGENKGHAADGDGKAGHGDEHGGDGHGAGDHDGPAGGDHDAKAHGGDDAAGGGGDQEAGNRAENHAAEELSDMGYPNATRAKGDEAAEAIAGGQRPNHDSVRETEANQRGLVDLNKVNADPTITPEGKQNIRRDVAEGMRSEEPTGNLQRDVEAAKTREAERAKAAEAQKKAGGAEGEQRYASDGGPHPDKVAEVLATPKGERPHPHDYHSPEYVQAHADAFAEGGSRIVLEASHDKYGTFREDGTTFVMTKADCDALIARAGGDPAKLEVELGLPAGQLTSGGGKLVRIDFPPGGHRIPSGNEAGANSQWIPGGKTPNGNHEAVVHKNEAGTPVVTPISPGGSGP